MPIYYANITGNGFVKYTTAISPKMQGFVLIDHFALKKIVTNTLNNLAIIISYYPLYKYIYMLFFASVSQHVISETKSYEFYFYLQNQIYCFFKNFVI